ncbi:MAG: RNA polymerase factor sigma-54 [Chlamydiae bacterium]|nr:RNA polymerase factor sigma-54 [Chlamydiota bacterium]
MQLKAIRDRQLTFSLALRQAVSILQMPNQELSLWLQREIEKNPLLELPECGGKGEELQDICSTLTLYEFLSLQIQETFLNPSERRIAEILVGFLDERGFFTTPFSEIETFSDLPLELLEKVLQTVQSFEPSGIAARNLQECLLLQLKNCSEMTKRIVQDHFEDLLHGRYGRIKKKLKLSSKEFDQAIEKLSRLNLRPAAGFNERPQPTRLADLRAHKTSEAWIVEVADEEFPKIQIREDFHSLLSQLSAQEQKSLKTWLTSAKWLKRSLSRRGQLLTKIASHLLDKQTEYLEHRGSLQEITAADLACLLGVHESTIHRALSEKMIEGPWGLIELKSLLSQPAIADHQKRLLRRLIEQENKQNPLTDEELSALLKKKGISLARRTVAKYRKELKLASASRRKQSFSIQN